jgi:hypothetical protein
MTKHNRQGTDIPQKRARGVAHSSVCQGFVTLPSSNRAALSRTICRSSFGGDPLLLDFPAASQAWRAAASCLATETFSSTCRMCPSSPLHQVAPHSVTPQHQQRHPKAQSQSVPPQGLPWAGTAATSPQWSFCPRPAPARCGSTPCSASLARALLHAPCPPPSVPYPGSLC